MKLTLVQPYYFNIWEALGIGYLGAYCKNQISDIDINFFQAYFDSDDMIVDGCKSSDYVGFSCTSPTFQHGIKLAKRIKEVNPSCKIIFGGNHVSGIPDHIDEKCIDHIVVGEGEKALVKILSKEETDRVVYGYGWELEFYQLPWPDRDLIKNDRTIDLCEKVAGIRSTSFLAHRGCPFRCKYCGEKTISGIRKVRTRSIFDILDEIEFVSKKYQLNFFKFADATFDVSASWVIDFCEQKIRRGIDLPWECMVHANCATEEMIVSLKRANCHQINVGCESGSNRILKKMNKGVTREKIIQVFDWAKQNHLERRSFFILGFPDENYTDIDETSSLISRIAPEVFGATILCPYPGCDLYDHTKFKDVDWSKTDEYSNDFWNTYVFSNSQLKSIQSDLANKYSKELNWHQKQLSGNGHE